MKKEPAVIFEEKILLDFLRTVNQNFDIVIKDLYCTLIHDVSILFCILSECSITSNHKLLFPSCFCNLSSLFLEKSLIFRSCSAVCLFLSALAMVFFASLCHTSSNFCRFTELSGYF